MPLDRGSEEEMNTFQAEKSDWGSTKGGRISFEAAWSGLERSRRQLKKKRYLREHTKKANLWNTPILLFFLNERHSMSVSIDIAQKYKIMSLGDHNQVTKRKKEDHIKTNRRVGLGQHAPNSTLLNNSDRSD